MIKDLLFVLKMLVITVVVSLTLQTKIGEKSIEDNFHQWLKTSVFVEFIQEAIDGGVALTKAGYKNADKGVRAVLAKLHKRPEATKDRSLSSLSLKRHTPKDDDDDEEEAGENLPVAHPPKAATAVH